MVANHQAVQGQGKCKNSTFPPWEHSDCVEKATICCWYVTKGNSRPSIGLTNGGVGFTVLQHTAHLGTSAHLLETG